MGIRGCFDHCGISRRLAISFVHRRSCGWRSVIGLELVSTSDVIWRRSSLGRSMIPVLDRAGSVRSSWLAPVRRFGVADILRIASNEDFVLMVMLEWGCCCVVGS